MVSTRIPDLATLCQDKALETITQMLGNKIVCSCSNVKNFTPDDTLSWLHSLPKGCTTGRSVSGLDRGGLLCKRFHTLKSMAVQFRSCLEELCSDAVDDNSRCHYSSCLKVFENSNELERDVRCNTADCRDRCDSALLQGSADVGSELLILCDNLSADFKKCKKQDENEAATPYNVSMDSENIRIENENVGYTREVVYLDRKERRIDNVENENKVSTSDVLLESKRNRNEKEVPTFDVVSLDSKTCRKNTNRNLDIIFSIYLNIQICRKGNNKLHNYEADSFDNKSASIVHCVFSFRVGIRLSSRLSRTKRADIARMNRIDIARMNRTDIARMNRTDIARMNKTDIAGNREFIIMCSNRTLTVAFLCLVHEILREQNQLLILPHANKNSSLFCFAAAEWSVLDFLASLLIHENTEKASVARLNEMSCISDVKNTYRQNIRQISAPLNGRSVTHVVKNTTTEYNNLEESSTIHKFGSNHQMEFLDEKRNVDNEGQMQHRNAVDTVFHIKLLGGSDLSVLVKNQHGRNVEEERNLSLDFLDCIRLKKLQSQMQFLDVENIERFMFIHQNPYGFTPSKALRDVCVNMLPHSACGISWDQFERETMRLASFALYPASAAKSPANLASCGFVYVGNGANDRVKCYFCSAEKEKWEMNDDIDDIHKSLSPSCPMVVVQCLNNVASILSSPVVSGVTQFSSSVPYGLGPHRPMGAVASSLDTATGSAYSPYDDVDYFRTHANGRPATESTNQPSLSQTATAVTPMLPNANGSLNTPESTNRASLLVLGAFQDATDSVVRSNRISPGSQSSQNSESVNEVSARNLQNLQNYNSTDHPDVVHHPNINSQVYAIPPGTADSQSSPATTRGVQPTSQLTYQLLGIFHERPKFPEYAVLARRLQSFDGWPEDHPISKEALAKSGLFFAGYGDCCKCFFCGGGLRNWENDDDAYVEHARWFDKCSYIRQFMGLEFVEAVQSIKNRGGTITFNNVTDYMAEKGQSINLFNERKISDDAAVKSLIDEGYDREAVSRAAFSLRESGDLLSADVILRKMRDQPPGASGVAAAEAVVGENGATYSEDVPDEGQLQALKEQNYALRNNLTCKICMDKEVRIVFLPCGHLISCQECAIALQDCPLCRSHIRARARANIN